MSIEPSYHNLISLQPKSKEPLQFSFVTVAESEPEPQSDSDIHLSHIKSYESDLAININVTNTLSNIIEKHYNTLSDIIIKQIQNLSVKILELIEPILKEDEELLISLKFTKSHLDVETP